MRAGEMSVELSQAEAQWSEGKAFPPKETGCANTQERSGTMEAASLAALVWGDEEAGRGEAGEVGNKKLAEQPGLHPKVQLTEWPQDPCTGITY